MTATLVSRAPLLFSFIKLSSYYPAHFSDSLLLDCYVSILRTFRILFHKIVTLVSRALLGIAFIGLLFFASRALSFPLSLD